MNPIIYIPQEYAHLTQFIDACRNWLAREGFATPEVVHRYPDGEPHLLVVWSIHHLSLMALQHIVLRGGAMISVCDDIDTRGRNACSIAQIKALRAFAGHPAVSSPYREEEKPVAKPVGADSGASVDRDEAVAEHYSIHGTGSPRKLAFKLGVLPSQASAMLRAESDAQAHPMHRLHKGGAA